MNKKAMGGAGIALICIGIVVFLLIISTIGAYNGLVSSDEDVQQKWGNVESAYQRRADLIPNLIETVKGYAKHEKSTLTELTELRSQVGKAQTGYSNADNPQELQQADASMNSALSRLLVIVENYPDLKANQNFLAFQDQLEGTENRIKYERDEYNNAVKFYRTKVRRFPTNMVAGMFGFDRNEYDTFKADEGSDKAPKVNFEI